MAAAVQGELPGTGPGLVSVQSARLRGPTQATLAIMRQRSGQNFLPPLALQWPPPASVPCHHLGTRVTLSYIRTAVCSCFQKPQLVSLPTLRVHLALSAPREGIWGTGDSEPSWGVWPLSCKQQVDQQLTHPEG